jgi:SAM-dependent methyltransferase
MSNVDWNLYATCYDLLCEMNPAYGDLVRHLSEFLASMPARVRALDVGAGTGNFVLAGAGALSGSTWTHLEPYAGMNAIARRKYERAGIDVRVVEQKAELASFEQASFDLIVSVNAMYAMPDPETILGHIASWLAPGGYLYLVDLGRIQNTLDWTQYLLRTNVRRFGLRKSVSILRNEGRVISTQNRRIAKLQRSGVYWRHSADELRSAINRSGLLVEEVGVCYRGYCDRAIARRPQV